MAYEYRKSRSLNKKERSRLRLSVVLDRQLRAMNEENRTGLGRIWKRYMGDVFRKIRLQCPGRGRHANLLDQLLLVFSRPSGNIEDTTIHWLLCYATPSVLKKLIAALAHEDPQNKYLELMKKADPSLLLTKNHMVPDFQKFQPYSGKPRKALICFSGNAHQLMVPLQLFHVLAVELFDLIIYLRDDRKQHFMYGIPGMGDNLTELGSTL